MGGERRILASTFPKLYRLEHTSLYGTDAEIYNLLNCSLVLLRSNIIFHCVTPHLIHQFCFIQFLHFVPFCGARMFVMTLKVGINKTINMIK